MRCDFLLQSVAQMSRVLAWGRLERFLRWQLSLRDGERFRIGIDNAEVRIMTKHDFFELHGFRSSWDSDKARKSVQKHDGTMLELQLKQS